MVYKLKKRGLLLLFLLLLLPGKYVFAETKLIGHRGYSSVYPENTIPALSEALKKGFDGVELDVYVTNSGEILVHHDAYLNRMTGEKTMIWQVQDRTLYPVNGGHGSKRYISKSLFMPMLEEVFRAMHIREGKIYLHIKEQKELGYSITNAKARRIIQSVKASGLSKRITLFGNKDTIAKFTGQNLQLAILTGAYKNEKLKEHVAWCKVNDVNNFMVLNTTQLKDPSNGPDFIRYCHKNHMKIGVYTVKTIRDMNFMDQMGVDYGISDYKLQVHNPNDSYASTFMGALIQQQLEEDILHLPASVRSYEIRSKEDAAISSILDARKSIYQSFVANVKKNFKYHNASRIRMLGFSGYLGAKVGNLYHNTIAPVPKYFHVDDWKDGKVSMRWRKVPDADGYIISRYDARTKAFVQIAKFEAFEDHFDYIIPKSMVSSKYRFQTIKRASVVDKNSFHSITCAVATKDTYSKEEIFCIGHRGVMLEAPENTMASFSLAHDYGYDAIETDFFVTDSGDIIASHDKNIEEMCGVDESVYNLSKNNLKYYPVVNGNNVKDYDTQYLPMLEDVVSAVSEWGMTLYLHTKNPNTTVEEFEMVYDLLNEYDMLDHTYIFTSNADCFERIQQLDWNYGWLKIPKQYTDLRAAIRKAEIGKAKFIIVKYRDDISEEMISYCKNIGIKFGCYNATEPEKVSRLINLGADFAIINGKTFKENAMEDAEESTTEE